MRFQRGISETFFDHKDAQLLHHGDDANKTEYVLRNHVIDAWMIYDFTSFSNIILFQPYQDDGREIIKTVCNGSPFTFETISALGGARARDC